MDDRKNQNKNRLEHILKQFSDDEREQVKDVWNESGKFDPAAEIPETEIEQALANVYNRIDLPQDATPEKSGKPGFRSGDIRVWAIAAVALIVFTAGWLLVPKTITVSNGEMAEVELPDGSSIELNSGTIIRYNRLFSYTNRSVTLHGEAFFDVQQSDLPFRVEANGTITEVTGTQFNIRSRSDDPGRETSVAVTEGEVRFYSFAEKEKKVTLRPGQSSRWNHGMAEPAMPDPVSVADVTSWREQRFVFQEKPVVTILQELERRFDVRIDLEAGGIALETLTAYYSKPQDLERILEDICMVKGLRYAETANGYRIFR